MIAERLLEGRLPVFIGFFVVLLIAESLWSARTWHDGRLKRLGFHASLSIFNTVVYWLTVSAPLIVWTRHVHEQGWGISGLLGLSGPAEIALSLVVLDLFDYGWHRANHFVPFLWRFHRSHHVDTHVDVTTSMRFHIGELLLSAAVKCLWVVVWGPSLAAFILLEAGVTAYAQFHHSNIDLPDSVERVVRWVHMTPRLHAAHHTVGLRTRDANYSTIFLWWDFLFGTFREADYSEMRRLGIKEGRRSDLNLGAFLKSPFVIGP